MLVIDPLSIPEVVQNFTTNQPLHPNFNMSYPFGGKCWATTLWTTTWECMGQ